MKITTELLVPLGFKSDPLGDFAAGERPKMGLELGCGGGYLTLQEQTYGPHKGGWSAIFETIRDAVVVPKTLRTMEDVHQLLTAIGVDWKQP